MSSLKNSLALDVCLLASVRFVVASKEKLNTVLARKRMVFSRKYSVSIKTCAETPQKPSVNNWYNLVGMRQLLTKDACRQQVAWITILNDDSRLLDRGLHPPDPAWGISALFWGPAGPMVAACVGLGWAPGPKPKLWGRSFILPALVA